MTLTGALARLTHRKATSVSERSSSVRYAAVDRLLAAAREGVERLDPHQARAAQLAGALLVDTRTDAQRDREGDLPGAVVIDRTVLEWRLDPTSEWRIPEASDPNLLVVVVCRQGYSSSLAAASLRALGLHRATDLVGGAQAWFAAGLPSLEGAADVRE
jgi:rhodanese-related sulfurtransferase